MDGDRFIFPFFFEDRVFREGFDGRDDGDEGIAFGFCGMVTGVVIGFQSVHTGFHPFELLALFEMGFG